MATTEDREYPARIVLGTQLLLLPAMALLLLTLLLLRQTDPLQPPPDFAFPATDSRPSKIRNKK